MEITVLLVDDEAIDLEWLRVRVAGGNYNSLRIAGAVRSGFDALKMMEIRAYRRDPDRHSHADYVRYGICQ
ncbi:hypothetical protein [Paenibacillus sp. MY03]|jgi:YesN/AraC family two-component response regulator|uniref:hypothetical protein n=1 Tax=Paenibacillus sp. MY03 TaxID=302980 RepID=UPI00211B6990|nr:hypothetical protein [Paenibacillus sp. MY03]